jgi:WD40 repeat protein
MKTESFFPEVQPGFRVIISLREDYLADLIDLKSRINSIDRILFRVILLSGRQARKIVGMPGGFEDPKTINNILRSFYFGEEKEDEEIPDEKLEVEPALLSLICSEVYEEREKVESFTKKDRDRILASFYDSVMRDYPEEVKLFIEDNLLSEGGRFRTHYPLESSHPLKESILQLVDKRILRKDYMGEKEYIEIIHDVLAPIIAEKRDMRLAKEERKESWKKFVRKFVSNTAALLLLISVYAVYQTVRAINQSRIAQVNWLTAEALLEFPKDNTRAVRIAAESFKKGLPHPPARTCRILSDIAYSSYQKPFYSATLYHKDSIYSAVFSPDGQKILTASEDKTAKLWRIEGKRKTDPLILKHEARVMSAVFSPDGKYLLTASWDKTAKLWSFGGKLQAEFKHDGPVSSAVFSSTGELILTASRDNTAKLWGLEGKLLATSSHDAAISSVMFSPDNKHILTASWDKTAKLWNQDGKLLKEFPHDGAVESAVFSPDGKYILTASWEKSAKLWKSEGKLLAELQHDGAVASAVFSNDGKQILTASRDKSVKLWNLQGKILLKLEFDKEVSSAKFSSDNRYIFTVSRDHIARAWNRKGEFLSELKHNGDINSAVFSNDNKWILTASGDGTAKLWGLENKIITDLDKHTAAVKTAVFSPDGSKILTASNDNTAILWNFTSASRQHIIFCCFFSGRSKNSYRIYGSNREIVGTGWQASQKFNAWRSSIICCFFSGRQIHTNRFA